MVDFLEELKKARLIATSAQGILTRFCALSVCMFSTGFLAIEGIISFCEFSGISLRLDKPICKYESETLGYVWSPIHYMCNDLSLVGYGGGDFFLENIPNLPPFHSPFYNPTKLTSTAEKEENFLSVGRLI